MNSSTSWHERWLGWRNSLLASSRFQAFAVRFPATRFIARRRAAALFDLVAGFTYSQILAACIETGVLNVLAQPMTAADIAGHIDLPAAATERLLRAAAALGLVEPVGQRWALGSGGAALRGNPGIAEIVSHHRLLYADLADPVALLRRGGGGGALSDYWRYAESPGDGDASAVSAYSTLMAASQPLVAAQAIAAYPIHRHRRLLDVGGGEGAFLTAVAAQAATIELGLFDLPAVADRARSQFADAGLSDRTAVHGGDFLAGPLPAGYDLISLVRVLHDHDDDAALRLLRNVRSALPSGGALLVVEPMAGTPGAEPAGDAYFGFYLLAMGSGQPRHPNEIFELLRQAGFGRSRLLQTALPLTTRAIVAVT